MKQTFITYATDGEKCSVVEHDTLEEAIERANEYGLDEIEENGGNWETWRRCWFCGEFFPESDLNEEGECLFCEQAIKSHGG